MSQDTIIDAIQIVIAITSGIGIAWYWNWQNHKLSEYRYLDQIYWKLLEAYRSNPRFADETLTNNYRDSFRDAEASQYHCFAMCAHTAMETIYDVYSSNIPREWEHIYRYHTALHAEWLQDNRKANRWDYGEHCLKLRSSTQVSSTASARNKSPWPSH